MIREIGTVIFRQKLWGAKEHVIQDYFINAGYLHGNLGGDLDSEFTVPIYLVQITDPPAREHEI